MLPTLIVVVVGGGGGGGVGGGGGGGGITSLRLSECVSRIDLLLPGRDRHKVL